MDWEALLWALVGGVTMAVVVLAYTAVDRRSS